MLAFFGSLPSRNDVSFQSPKTELIPCQLQELHFMSENLPAGKKIFLTAISADISKSIKTRKKGSTQSFVDCN